MPWPSCRRDLWLARHTDGATDGHHRNAAVTETADGKARSHLGVRARTRRAPSRRCSATAAPTAACPAAAESIASSLFAASLLPYLGFLYHLTKSATAPRLTLFGFYFLLAFVGATTKLVYNTSLSNVDYLHGSAESLLTITNLLIVLGLRQGLREAADGSPADEGETRATAEMTGRTEESSMPLSKEGLLFSALGPPQIEQQEFALLWALWRQLLENEQCDDAGKPLLLPFCEFCTLSVYGPGCKQADLLGSLSKDKKHGVDDIALPTPIWSHNRREALQERP
eukprot:SM000187S03859  [mRNA]  locus=s187:14283:24397:+ [translate_table: standard]